MTRVQAFYARTALAACVTFLGFFLLGYGGIMVSAGRGNAVAVIWPATAFGMCMLLRLSRDRRIDAVLLPTHATPASGLRATASPPSRRFAPNGEAGLRLASAGYNLTGRRPAPYSPALRQKAGA